MINLKRMPSEQVRKRFNPWGLGFPVLPSKRGPLRTENVRVEGPLFIFDRHGKKIQHWLYAGQSMIMTEDSV